jgi:limonene-1,2-epoxide hydrolase
MAHEVRRVVEAYVEVPMLGVYEIANGKIQRARLYYDMATLSRQLGQVS